MRQRLKAHNHEKEYRSVANSKLYRCAVKQKYERLLSRLESIYIPTTLDGTTSTTGLT